MTPSERDHIRERIVRLMHSDQPDDHAIVGSMIANMLLVARHLPLNSRVAVAEALRDAADLLEHIDNGNA